MQPTTMRARQGHRALPRIFANPKESQPAEITQLLFQSGSKTAKPMEVQAFNNLRRLGYRVETG
jgi:hypothetical protein